MAPYYICPYTMDRMSPLTQPMMQPVQQMQPMTNIPIQQMMQPMSPLYQPQGMNMPLNMNDMNFMGNINDLNNMDQIDMGPSTAKVGDPPPLLSNNPATARIVLFKELTAYSNYGNPSGNADILYTGNRGTWTFEIPAFLFVPGNLTGQLVIRAVLDDHANVPVNRYAARITINGIVVHNGSVPLEHGIPAGQKFINWKDLMFNMPVIRRTNRIVIVNTSTTGPNDWIGIDWMEMRLSPIR